MKRTLKRYGCVIACALITQGMASTGFADEGGEAGLIQKSIRMHKESIRECTERPVSVNKKNLIVYTISTNDADTFACLLSKLGIKKSVTGKSKGGLATYTSRIDLRYSPEDGSGTGMLEAAMKAAHKIVLVSAMDSDDGLESIVRLKDGRLLASSGYATHSRNYLVSVDDGSSVYLVDGSKVVPGMKLSTFRVDGIKSFFKEGGAFWYNALIDEKGNVLQIFKPVDSEYVNCMPRKKFEQVSDIDISRTSSPEICFKS